MLGDQDTKHETRLRPKRQRPKTPCTIHDLYVRKDRQMRNEKTGTATFRHNGTARCKELGHIAQPTLKLGERGEPALNAHARKGAELQAKPHRIDSAKAVR